MTSQNLWARLSVQDFFQGYNWLGASPILEPTITDENADVPSLLCLKVTDFLNQANWQGETITPNSSPVQAQLSTNPFSFTLPVAEFMNFINWQGDFKAGSGMQSKDSKVAMSFATPASEIDLDDLSNLF